ncbi:MAG: bacillithiol system redox-active protein YtxJ [Rhodothermales bacterium]
MNRFFKRLMGDNSYPEMSADARIGFLPLDSDAAWNDVIARSEREPVVVFKHSLTCGISAGARRRMLEMGSPGDPPVYELVVQHARPLSNAIATSLGVRHESPQVLVLHAGRVVFHTSHGSITPDRVRAAAQESRIA